MLKSKALISAHRVEGLLEAKAKGKAKGKIRLLPRMRLATQTQTHRSADHAEHLQVANPTSKHVSFTSKEHALKATHATSGTHQCAATSRRVIATILDVFSSTPLRLTQGKPHPPLRELSPQEKQRVSTKQKAGGKWHEPFLVLWL